MVGRYQAYPEYKDSGVEWFGEIPSHWDVAALRRYLLDHKQGYYTTDGYVDDGVKLLRITDLRDYGEIDIMSCPKVPNNDASLSSYELKNGDVVFARTGGAGSFGVVTDLKERVVFASYLIRFRFCNNFVENSFLQYMLLADSFQKAVQSNIHGGVNQNIHAEDIKNTFVALPSFAEQQKLANFLNHETAKIDTLIEKQQKLIKLLKEKRQAVISHAVTKGLNPDAPMKDSGVEWLGEVPEHWLVTELRYIVKQTGGGTPSKDIEDYWNGEIPWVSPKDMKVNYIGDSQDKITEQAVNNSSAKFVPKGSVLLVVRGMILIHSVPVALTLKKLTVNQDMKALIPARNIDGEYLLFLLMGLRDFILDIVDSSAHGTKCLRTELFERMKIAIPSNSEQIKIISYLREKSDHFDSLVEKSRLLIDFLQERRTAIISAAVTGEIDVRNWQAPNPKNNQINKAIQ